MASAASATARSTDALAIILQRANAIAQEAVLFDHQGRLLEALGKYREAVQLYRIILQSTPSYGLPLYQNQPAILYHAYSV